MKRRLKEQVKSRGLPAPTDLANKINGAGMSGDEVLAWLGDVLRRVSPGGGPTETEEVEVAEIAPSPLPEPELTPAAMQERLEDSLLKTLLSDIKQVKRRK